MREVPFNRKITDMVMLRPLEIGIFGICKMYIGKFLILPKIASI